MNSRIYLDYNATAKIRPEALGAATAALALGANPSSVHADGRAARAIVEQARAQVALLAGAPVQSVTFVSGGTEANALAVESAAQAGCDRIWLGATEHAAVREAAFASGLPVEVWPVDAAGRADLNWLEARAAKGAKALVCLMLANNETGVVQPVAQAAQRLEGTGAWLHVDAVQAAGKMALDMATLGADSLALSAHKLGGPQGVGALLAAPRARLSRRLHGGGQEGGRRAGTENLSGIAGFGAAAQAAARDLPNLARQAVWRAALAERLKVHGAIVIGDAAERLPQTLCVATPGFSAELQVMALDLAGVMVSAGAACSSGKVKASAVVEAMGRPDLAPFAIRVSGGWASTDADWTGCGDAWLAAYHTKTARHLELA